MTETPWTEPAAASGTMRILLRLEEVVFALVAIALYYWIGASWWLFAAVILAPDLGLLGYLLGPKAGATTYNALHLTVFPLVLGLAWTYVVVAELIGSSSGIGHMIIDSQALLATGQIIFGIIVIGIIGLISDFLFKAANRKLFHWSLA